MSRKRKITGLAGEMDTLIKKYYANCLKSDLPSAIKVLQNSARTAKEEKFLGKVKSRFVNGDSNFKIRCQSDFVKSVIKVYRSYYRKALLCPKKSKEFEKDLFSELKKTSKYFGVNVPTSASKNRVEKILAAEFKGRGFNSVFGTVRPFRSLLVWSKETTKSYKISLLEKKQEVKVVLMDQFIELGWLHFATFGKYYVGGWAKKNLLFCVQQAYRIDSATFFSHYLSHEAQHFADFRSFPRLNQTDLEYRAKLAELFSAPSPKRFIDKLKSEAKNDPKLPHSFAAHKILAGMSRLPAMSARNKAVLLLTNHSKLLRAKGAKTVQSVLR